MKTYTQFIEESHSARENIQEAIPLALIGAAKLASMGLSAYSAYSAAQNLKKGKYGDAALDALGVVPGGVAFKGARALGASRNLARGASATQSVARNFAPNARNRAIEGGIDMATKAALGTGTASASQTEPSKTQPASSTQPSQPSQPSQPAPRPKPSSVVLARKGGVMGKLDKATGKWTKGDWTKQESDRYKRVAAQKAAPKPAPVVKSNNINLPSAVTAKSAVKKSVPVGDTVKTKVNPDSSLQVTQRRSKEATEKIKKSLDIN
tara:strand:+ start:550 stop:1347 length:798 start_codon:yes stop_codon:yes gene_type:complete